MKTRDFDVTNFLEGQGLERAKETDLSVLSEAGKYNATIEDLENVRPKTSSQSVEILKKDTSWRMLDINLFDVINQFIASSERPTFLIRDDSLVYLNPAALKFLEMDTGESCIGSNFFNLVVKEDWKLLAETIGEMLTSGAQLKVRLQTATGKVKPQVFSAVYLSEIEHFSFILLGEHPKRNGKSVFNNLYDELTGLPNFFLFEDRVHVAISLENAKENVSEKRMLAVAAINIDNMGSFEKMNIEELVLKKTARNLVLNLPKTATVSLGLKYHFWILLPALKSKEDVSLEIRRIIDILNEGVHDNLTHHEIIFSMGVSVFPYLGKSAKKLIEQALGAVKIAQNNPKSSVEFFAPPDI